jgi:hypothetical protein
MCTSAQLGPALLYLLVAYFSPLSLLSVLLAILPSVRLSRRLGVSRALAAWSLIPVVGPTIFLWSVVSLKRAESSAGFIDRFETNNNYFQTGGLQPARISRSSVAQ